MQAVVRDRWWAVRGLIRDCLGASLGSVCRGRRGLGGKWCRIVSYTHCNQPVTRQTSKEVHHTDSSTEALTWTLTANVGETVVFQVSSLEQLLLLPSAKRRAFNNEKKVRDRTQVSKHSAFVIADERRTQQLPHRAQSVSRHSSSIHTSTALLGDTSSHQSLRCSLLYSSG